ncbi:uncharacterized protein LOC108676758 isoform X2 [Hyalella azteca]|uniref:Uncharacterized protein LOC108676758 isoform X2 n=1 Tax=Hyalella azteca TaxID=294128 RepID=A0A8B7P2Y1_HYAAZ|nr:uncharacterized protein LOC108676758 isoform X2 [Hyalella azteca]
MVMECWLRAVLFRLAVLVCVVGALGVALPGEVLRYDNGASRRQEEGEPGRRVTGEWSWVDAAGHNHRVRYIADEFGFKAFGSVDPRSDSGANSGTVKESDLLAPTGSSRSLKRTDRKLTDVTTQSPRPILETTNSANFVVLEEADLKNGRHDQVRANLVPSDDKSRKISAVERMAGISVGELAKLKAKSDVKMRMKKGDPTVKLEPSAIGKMLLGDVSRSSNDLFHSELPNPIDGTDFVLIDSLQPPTVPKQRTPHIRIIPVLVTASKPKDVISGVHTSSKSKSFSALVTPNPEVTSAPRKSIVPQPLKVEGNLNFDNFFSPINLAKMTPPPFEIGSLDDYYYDYDYYDYADLSSNTTTNSTDVPAPNIVELDEESSSQPTDSPNIPSTTPATAKVLPRPQSPSFGQLRPVKVISRFNSEPDKGRSEIISTPSSSPVLPESERSSPAPPDTTTTRKRVVTTTTDAPRLPSSQFSFPPTFPPPPRIGKRIVEPIRHSSGGVRRSKMSRIDDNSASKEHRSSEDELDNSTESTQERDD